MSAPTSENSLSVRRAVTQTRETKCSQYVQQCRWNGCSDVSSTSNSSRAMRARFHRCPRPRYQFNRQFTAQATACTYSCIHRMQQQILHMHLCCKGHKAAEAAVTSYAASVSGIDRHAQLVSHMYMRCLLSPMAQQGHNH